MAPSRKQDTFGPHLAGRAGANAVLAALGYNFGLLLRCLAKSRVGYYGLLAWPSSSLTAIE
jgi:hypothetical protein